jgi:hypothetical protein
MADAAKNPFDQFDKPATDQQQNPFDQFDFGKHGGTVGDYASVAGRSLARGAAEGGSSILKGLSLLPDAGMGEAATPQSVDIARQVEATPVTQRPLYQAGQAVEEKAAKTFPLTRAEEQSVTGQVGRTIGSTGVQIGGAMLAGPMALPVGASLFAASSAGSEFDKAIHSLAEQTRDAAAFGGATPEEQQAAYDHALTTPENLSRASHAAGLSALVGGSIGVLPLGVILRPVSREAPGLMGWAAAKLQQAVQSGAVFSSVGEAQHYLGQEIAKEYDPNARYEFDPKRVTASLIAGGAFGVVHPLSPAQPSSAAEINDFMRQADATAPQRPSQTASDINEFIRRRDAGWTYDDATDQWSPPAAAAGLPRLPPPFEDAGPTAPAASAPPNAPAPEAPAAPVAGARPLDTAFPSLEEPGRSAPPAAPDNPFNQFDVPQEMPNDRQGGQQVRGEVGERQAPGVLQQPGGSGAPPQAGGILQAPQGGEKPENPPQPNVGTATLQALLADPRSADEIRAEIAAERARSDAAHARGAADAQASTTTAQTDVLSPQPVASDLPVAPGGAREAPIALTGPGDLYTGAERTGTPTPAQAEAGNYRKRHVTWQGLDIAIETEAGQDRTGIGSDGQPWSVTLQHPYGYIKGTLGRDGDQVDVYLGPEPQSPTVYIVDQIDHRTGGFDEHKALIGFPDEASARAAYVAGFSDSNGPARVGSISALPVSAFKDWLAKGQRRAPVAYTDPVREARAIAKEHGLNATDAEIEAAVLEQKVSNTDLTEALFAVVEHSAIVDEAESPDSVQRQEEAHGRPVEPTGPRETSAEPSAPSAEAGIEGARAPEQASARLEPHEAERDRGAAAPVEVPTPAEPVIESPALTVATLQKLIPKIKVMAADRREETRRMIDDQLAAMESEGKKIAEHCLEVGSRFSVR